MLRVGYGLMMTAGLLLCGYVAFLLIRLVIEAPGLGVFFKVVILVGVAGFLTTLAGLVVERRKERGNDPGDD